MTPLLRAFLSRVVINGRLNVFLASGASFAVGDGNGASVTIRFRDNAAAWRLITNPSLALGELYMDGRLEVVDGDAYDLLALVCRNLGWQHPPGAGVVRNALRRVFRFWQQRNTRSRARRNVAHHYDLDSRFYALFLDNDLQYSCAYFEHDGQSLQDAQMAKKRHIAAKLLVERGQKVLDIGCGWGGLALYLAQTCGADVTGITLSSEQADVARERAAHSGRSSRPTFLQEDYRTLKDRFDRIISVGMFEHVGVGYYDEFFKSSFSLLKDDGVMLLHAIGRMDGPGVTNPWIDKYIFPGGYAPALSEVLTPIERSQLVVTDIEVLRLHYAETLRNWRESFMRRRADAVKLFDERFCRLWEFYLAASEAAFRYNGLMVFQIQLSKRQEAVPLTRDYIASRERQLAALEREGDVIAAE